jgi:DNA-binding CsgD family transcriptional regulator
MNNKFIPFSEREIQVIDEIMLGKSNKQIATDLHISIRTVEFHNRNIYDKLGVVSRAEAILKLSENHLWETPGDVNDNNQGISTVAIVGELPDNNARSIRRRISMKNVLYAVFGGVITIGLIVTLLLTNPGILKPAATPEVPSQPLPTSKVTRITEVAQQQTNETQKEELPIESTDPTEDIAHFVSENYPDDSRLEPGTTFTKTWKLENKGKATWTTGYTLTLTDSFHPLGSNLSEPYQVSLPKEVKPGDSVEILMDFTVPDADGIYEVHYRLKNPAGQSVFGDGGEIWIKIIVGDVQVAGGSSSAGDITITLVSVEKTETLTNVEVCAQLPDLQDWNLSGVILTAGNVQNSLSGYMLKNPKSASTYANSYRCIILEFPVGVSNYGSSPVSVSISSIRVPAENYLELNCARAKQVLGPLYPGLDFTCGPLGFYYTNLVLPGGMTESQADILIMDALEQAIYGPWYLNE